MHVRYNGNCGKQERRSTMSTHKNIDRICVIITVLSLILTILFINGEALGIEVIRDADAEDYTGTEWFTANDLYGDWDDSGATVITLKEDTAKVTGGGAYAYKGSVVITQSGKYTISGTLTDGNITVDAEDFSKVWICLDGTDITCSDDACLIVDQADKVFLTLGAGTDNYMTGGSRYSDEAKEDNTGGVIFTHDDLTINGSGTLTITAPYKHGIDSNDELVITGGTISISSSSDGVHVNDSFRMTDASLIISAGDDAIHCDKEICIAGGSILIQKCYEGLEARTIDITDGNITIYPSDDGINANGGNGWGFGYVPSLEEDDEEDDGPTYIRIGGGILTIINTNGRDADGLDSNGDIYIDGGTIRISLPGSDLNNAIDYGSESGYDCIVTGGDLIACGGSMMAEPFSSASTQCAVIMTIQDTISAETPFSVIDTEGNVILSDTPVCNYSSVAFSSPSLAVGKSYTVRIGSSSMELTLNSTATKVKASLTPDSASSETGHGGSSGQPGSPGENDKNDPSSESKDDGFSGGGFPGGGQGGQPGGGGGGGFPGGGGGGFPGGNSGSSNNGSSGSQGNSGNPFKPATASEWTWLAISAAVLIAGLTVAMLYNRRKHI